jgi:hypothetical protein
VRAIWGALKTALMDSKSVVALLCGDSGFLVQISLQFASGPQDRTW